MGSYILLKDVLTTNSVFLPGEKMLLTRPYTYSL